MLSPLVFEIGGIGVYQACLRRPNPTRPHGPLCCRKDPAHCLKSDAVCGGGEFRFVGAFQFKLFTQTRGITGEAFEFETPEPAWPSGKALSW